MGKLAFLFAGQGAQAPGMGKSLYDRGGAAAQAFELMEAQRPGTMADCFEAPAERLAQTSVTQPCVYTVDMACAAALAEAGVQPQGAAGFSLGEMTALTFSGVFSIEDGAKVVHCRGELMEQAAAEHPGAMAAVMRLEDAKVEELCTHYANLWPVNYNCPGQLVVAGDASVMEDFCAEVKAMGGMAKLLAVGGAFHTPLMQQASQQFAQVLADVKMADPAIPVYANQNAKPYEAPYDETLAAQMCNPVRWNAAMLQMKADGFDTFVEVGPGKALSGFMRRIWPEARICNVQDAETLDAALAFLNG